MRKLLLSKKTAIFVFVVIALVLAFLTSALRIKQNMATQVITNTQSSFDNPHVQKIELEGGSTCYLIPGTAGIIASGKDTGQWFYYSCGNHLVILGSLDNVFDKANRIWKVRVAQLGDGEDEIGQAKTMDVLKTWQ